ncbi:MAG TPA: alcohol dehydrogenase catalytic domain-containing protein [Actinomycetota bacterium]|nr:alcohol dehydrogenase catalytic domain-containing protein [Actinomycetota bacterium]
MAVRVAAVGICGTDHSIYAGKIPVDYPRVMGHEIVGTIVGADAGPRVLVDPGIACGRCRQCLEDRANICTEGWLLGRDADGGLREVLTVPERNVHVLPERMDASTAPMVQVLATCVHAQVRCSPAAGESVVVLGLGVTGLLHVQLAKLRGADPVVGVTRSDAKLALAGTLGADVLVSADGSEAEEVRAALPGGADLVIDSAGTVETLARAVEMARIGGRILAYGTITGTSGSMSFYDLYYKELTVVGARSARAEDFPLALEAVASGRVQLAPLVSARFSLVAVPDAIEAAAGSGALKVFVDV